MYHHFFLFEYERVHTVNTENASCNEQEGKGRRKSVGLLYIDCKRRQLFPCVKRLSRFLFRISNKNLSASASMFCWLISKRNCGRSDLIIKNKKKIYIKNGIKGIEEITRITSLHNNEVALLCSLMLRLMRNLIGPRWYYRFKLRLLSKALFFERYLTDK